MGEIYGNKGSSWWRVYMTYSTSQTETTYSITATLYLYFSKLHTHNNEYDRPSYLAATGQTTKYFYPTGTSRKDPGGTYKLGSQTFTYTRGTSSVAKSLVGSIKHAQGDVTGTSTATVSFTVPVRSSWVVTFKNDNTPNASTFKTQTKYYGINIALQSSIPTKSGFTFQGWTTTQGGTTANYQPGSTYSSNQAMTLYPVWKDDNPPEIDPEDIPEITKSPEGKLIKNFSSVSVNIHDIDWKGKSINGIRFKVGEQTSSALAEGTLTINLNASGTFTPLIELENSLGTITRYELDTITVENPVWKTTVEETVQPIPDIDRNGNAIVTLEKYNFGSSAWEQSTENVAITETENGWKFTTTLEEKNIPLGSRTTANVSVSDAVRLSYLHTEANDTESRVAFFESTRNSNFSNGISNTVFIGGCRDSKYSSRVWWSYVNNPLYFPDTNYVEVGSNDTNVMGLFKIGDYLGVVKQSKTTDTAIFLVYPTSFDDDTTYAVKQGVSGVGALSKYSFNVLGDETLFLSPEGVMAIVPSEDEQHKTQNRSFFVDGKLLEEPALEGSYSFVFDGMYYLATGDSCYVLDGNQRNSWGNDKTNLVYECYYLTNIPARCFMRHEDCLWFSNQNELCRFKSADNPDAFVDGYDVDTDEKFVPVKAEWSTVLDDDGSLHYYKTMQKKGNVVSVLPRSSEHTEVLIKKDNEEPVLIQRTFSEASDIPSELYINKKFKKYKRLQFIIRNEEAESFGVDSITKSYSLGNYAKR